MTRRDTSKYLDTWALNRRRYPSFIERATLSTMEPTLVSGLDPTTLALFPDVSHWNQDLDIPRMVREGKIPMLVTKASDGYQMIAGQTTDLQTYKDDTLDENIQACYDVGIPCLIYHYVQFIYPNWTINSIIDHQFKVIQEAIGVKRPGVSFHGIILDVEERTSTGANAAEITMRLYRLLKARYPELPIIFYTSMSVLNLYPQLREQLSGQGSNYNLWMAQWVWPTSITTTWEYVRNTILPKLDMRVLTPGYATWAALQWTGDRIKVPGCSGAIDLNLWKGTPVQLYEFLNYKTTGTTPPPPPPPSNEFVKQEDFNKLVEELKKFVAEYESHTHSTNGPI